MNSFWAFSSALAKNSSNSAAVGMSPCPLLLILRAVAADLVGLVVEPGVAMVSGSLIKLQGVLSLVLLQSKS